MDCLGWLRKGKVRHLIAQAKEREQKSFYMKELQEGHLRESRSQANYEKSRGNVLHAERVPVGRMSDGDMLRMSLQNEDNGKEEIRYTEQLREQLSIARCGGDPEDTEALTSLFADTKERREREARGL